MTKLYFILLTILFLSACGSTSPSPSKVSTSNSLSKSTEKEVFQYDPQDHEQFVFGEVSPTLQQYAYRDVCFSLPSSSIVIDCLGNKLPYANYVGKKGYFTDRKPFQDSNGYVAKEAILETGEIIYTVTSVKYKHVGNTIIPLKEYEKQTGFVPEPIYKGSSVMLTGYSTISRGKLNVSSQDKHSLSEEDIEAIRRIAGHYPSGGARIADLLSTLKVDYDDFEGRTIISSLPYNNKDSFLSIRIVINDNGEAYPFMRTHYKAKDWLFINSFSVSADGFRWNSAKDMDFERDNSGGTIWEWNTTILTPEHIDMLSKMASAQAAKMRFQGRQYYADYELTDIQKDELGRLVEVAKLMTTGK